CASRSCWLRASPTSRSPHASVSATPAPSAAPTAASTTPGASATLPPMRRSLAPAPHSSTSPIAQSSGTRRATRLSPTARMAGSHFTASRKGTRETRGWISRPTARGGPDVGYPSADASWRRHRPLRLQPHHLPLVGVDGAAHWRSPQQGHLGWRRRTAHRCPLLPLPRRPGWCARARWPLAHRLLVAPRLGAWLRRTTLLGGDWPPLRRADGLPPPAPTARTGRRGGVGRHLGP